MPKGVEHRYRCASYIERSGLFSTLMPKGVEHDLARATGTEIPLALFSTLMPKGVEHSNRKPLLYRR